MSKQVPVYIKELSIVDFKGFRGEHRFSFVDENGDWCPWTVFLGNNNTGKTNILKAISILQPVELKGATTQGSEDEKLVVWKNFFGNLLKLPENSKLSLKRTNSETEFISGGFSPDLVLLDLKIYPYGVVRSIKNNSRSIDDNDLTIENNIIFNSDLINFEDWLLDLDYGANNPNSESKERFETYRELLKSVLTGDVFPEIIDIRFISDKSFKNYVEYKTEDGWHRMSELGYGYQSTLSWMADFCKKLFDRYPNSKNPLKEPAVLLVDEIDLHLHPQWQRGLINSLSSIFPKTQFIVTTHSPFIIQSMEKVNLYSLYHEGDHTIEKPWGINSYIGWTIEEILIEIMDMDGKMHTEKYNDLIKEFDDALDTDNYSQGQKAYNKLVNILNPQSEEHKLLEIQFTQLTPLEND